jgi:hypothetical protein
MARPDLQFSNLRSFASMRPKTQAGIDWIAENFGDESITYSIDGGAILIEFRYLEEIVLGARADGLVCEG